MKKIQSLGLLFALSCVAAGCSVDGTGYSSKNPTGTSPASGDDSASAGSNGGTASSTPASGNGGGNNGGSSMSNPTSPAPTPPAGKAMIRVVHASPDAPAVDVYAKGNDKPLATSISYGDTSSWIEVDSGTATIELRAAGSAPTSPVVYVTGALTLQDQANITAVAAGRISSNDASDSFRVIPVVNAFDAAASKTARVRVLHAGSDAPSVDLDVGNDDPTKPEVSGLARFADTGASGIALPSGKPLAIGIDAGGSRVTAFTTPSLPDGADLLVVATGFLGNLPREKSGFSLLVVGPNGNLGFIKQDPIVYTLHASPDAPSVDAFVGEAKIIDNLAFGKLTAPIQVQPGSYTVDVFAHSAGTIRPGGAPALSAPTGTLAAGERYLTIASGFLANAGSANGIQLIALREEFELGDANARLRVVHASPDAPAVDVGLITGTSISPVLVPNVKFGNASDENGLSAPIMSLPIGVTPASNDTTLVAKFSVPATSNERGFVIAAGALAPKAGEPAFRLAVVDTQATPWTVAHVFPH
jgi:hypothetical protein